MKFQVGSAQFAPTKGNIPENIKAIGSWIQQANREGCDILAFPETAVTGYYLEGGVLESALDANQLGEMLYECLGAVDHPIDALVGFIERWEGNLFNSAAYFEFSPTGVVLRGVYRKFFLATYGVFDEERFVSRGRELGVIDTRFGKVGILICEDVWHSVLPMLCAVAGAQVLFVPSASPGRGFSGEEIGNLERYGRMLRAVSEEHGVYCVNSQLCGFEGGKGLVGGSRIVDPFGRVLVESPILEPHLILAEVDRGLIAIARSQTPLISDLRSHWGDLTEIVRAQNP